MLRFDHQYFEIVDNSEEYDNYENNAIKKIKDNYDHEIIELIKDSFVARYKLVAKKDMELGPKDAKIKIKEGDVVLQGNDKVFFGNRDSFFDNSYVSDKIIINPLQDDFSLKMENSILNNPSEYDPNKQIVVSINGEDVTLTDSIVALDTSATSDIGETHIPIYTNICRFNFLKVRDSRILLRDSNHKDIDLKIDISNTRVMNNNNSLAEIHYSQINNIKFDDVRIDNNIRLRFMAGEDSTEKSLTISQTDFRSEIDGVKGKRKEEPIGISFYSKELVIKSTMFVMNTRYSCIYEVDRFSILGGGVQDRRSRVVTLRREDGRDDLALRAKTIDVHLEEMGELELKVKDDRSPVHKPKQCAISITNSKSNKMSFNTSMCYDLNSITFTNKNREDNLSLDAEIKYDRIIDGTNKKLFLFDSSLSDSRIHFKKTHELSTFQDSDITGSEVLFSDKNPISISLRTKNIKCDFIDNTYEEGSSIIIDKVKDESNEIVIENSVFKENSLTNFTNTKKARITSCLFYGSNIIDDSPSLIDSSFEGSSLKSIDFVKKSEVFNSKLENINRIENTRVVNQNISYNTKGDLVANVTGIPYKKERDIKAEQSLQNVENKKKPITEIDF